MSETRVPGKYGKRDPKRAPAPKLGNSLTGIVPSHPIFEDWLARLTSWQMLGNDIYGDCVAVTWANVRRLISTYLGTAEYPNLSEVYAFYKTQNPNFPSDDNGMDIQTAIEYLISHGGPDGVKALGYASVDYANPEEVKAAIALFGFVWTGLQVLDSNMTDFQDNRPWGYNANSAIDGGHSVIVGGYGPGETGQLSGDEKFITWAEETSFTDNFWANEVDEAWVVIFPEHLGSKEFLAGVDLQQLAADYKEITGQDFPVVVPPAPVPTPTPVPPVPTPIPTPVPPIPTPTPVPPIPSPKPSWWDDLIIWIEGMFKWLAGNK